MKFRLKALRPSRRFASRRTRSTEPTHSIRTPLGIALASHPYRHASGREFGVQPELLLNPAGGLPVFLVVRDHVGG